MKLTRAHYDYVEANYSLLPNETIANNIGITTRQIRHIKTKLGLKTKRPLTRKDLFLNDPVFCDYLLECAYLQMTFKQAARDLKKYGYNVNDRMVERLVKNYKALHWATGRTWVKRIGENREQFLIERGMVH